MNDCIFCQIVAGQAPSAKVYEDDIVLAFMDIRPINRGSCVVVPKQHYPHFIDIPDKTAKHLIIKAQAIARNIQKVFVPEKVGYVVHGYGVNHAHLNIIPLHRYDDIGSIKFAKIKDGKIVFDESILKIVDLAEREAQAKQIAIN